MRVTFWPKTKLLPCIIFPYSPDLALYNFYLFPKVEDITYFLDIDAMLHSVDKITEYIPTICLQKQTPKAEISFDSDQTITEDT